MILLANVFGPVLKRIFLKFIYSEEVFNVKKMIFFFLRSLCVEKNSPFSLHIIVHTNASKNSTYECFNLIKFNFGFLKIIIMVIDTSTQFWG